MDVKNSVNGTLSLFTRKFGGPHNEGSNLLLVYILAGFFWSSVGETGCFNLNNPRYDRYVMNFTFQHLKHPN
ncbi:unnamed protein product [Allacma fusca]|uniref:Uncharacterized protein n=1 Tax=Allacma fusca TaxID=39272 RepID=A0A8J2LQX2_9HEXA|nr:unnamed protein product [Allacma fusca]